jgi:hypothetical protein
MDEVLEKSVVAVFEDAVYESHVLSTRSTKRSIQVRSSAMQCRVVFEPITALLRALVG